MLIIFRGDDTSYGDFERKVCIYIKTTQDLTGWTASFQLIDNIKTFNDLTNGYVSFAYTAAETMEFPLGRTYATLKLFDSQGKTRTVKKIDVEVENQVPVMDAGVIAVSADCVISDYKSIGNKPSINGKTIEGHHTGEYYGLAAKEDVELCAACNAAQTVEIEALKVTTQQNATSIADQGVAIAKNTQDIIGCKASAAQNIKDIEQLKTKVTALGTEITTKVTAEETARKADTEAIRDDLEAEVSARKAADASIRADLETEKTTRGSDKAELNTKISTEKSNRETDVARLEDSLGSESSVRAAADASLETKLGATKSELNAKITTCEGNVTELREGVKSDLIYLKGKVDDADARLEQKISDETAARITAVTNEAATRKSEDDRIEAKVKQNYIDFSAKLNSEIQQRELVQNALASEIIRREAGDTANAAAIAAETEARITGDAQTLADAKAYTDQKSTAVMRYAGQKQTYNELISDPNARVVGNVYNVVETGANYCWNGSTWDKLSETIDLTPYAKKTELAAEKERAEAKEGEIAASVAAEKAARETAVQNEIENRTTADNALAASITEEANTARAKEAALGLRIDGVVTSYTAADEGIKADVNTKVAALNAKDTELAAQITNITKDTDGLIATERAARIAGDTAEQNAREAAVASEKTAREAADETEKSAREAADGTLDAKIDSEIENRNTAVTTLRTDATNLIAAEKSRAEDAEAALGTRITTETENRTAAITAAKTALESAIQNEKDARVGADNALGTRITTEVTDRTNEISRVETAYKAADTKLTNDLAGEVTQRTNADTSIRNDFAAEDTAIRGELTTGDANTLAAAKAYADSVGAKAMHFKGYVENRSALEAKSATAQQGDMYNVGSYTFDDGKTVLGANFAWTGSAWDKLSETIDLSPYAKTADVTASMASMKSELEGKITTEKNERIAKDEAQDAIIGANTTQIATNKTDIANAQTAITALQTNLGTVDAKVVKEIEDRKEAITTVNGTITATKTALEGKINDVKAALQAEDSRLAGLIATETTNRSTEIARVEGLITAEGTTRAGAITTLTASIEGEVTRATAAEGVLTGQIASEADARLAADTTLNGAITAEQTARAKRDGELTTLINNIDLAYKAADTTLDGKITAGIAECKAYTDSKYRSVDEELAELQAAVDACNRAVNTWQTQITENKTNLENEITRAKAREDGLDARLDSTVTSANKAMPKSYIDAVDAKLDSTVSSTDKAMPKSYVDAADTAIDNKLDSTVSSSDKAMPKSYVDAVDGKLDTTVTSSNKAMPKTYIDTADKAISDKLDSTVKTTDKAMPKSYIDGQITAIKEGTQTIKQLAFTSTSAGASGKTYTLTVVLDPDTAEPTIQLVETSAS